MMTHRDRCDASTALMDWFESQDMSVGEAATVMGYTLAAMAAISNDTDECIRSVTELAKAVVRDMR